MAARCCRWPRICATFFFVSNSTLRLRPETLASPVPRSYASALPQLQVTLREQGMVAPVTTTLSSGDVAIIGYNMGMSDASGNPDTQDKLYFVALAPILSGTTIFFTDK